ncbi:MAG: hypothetical protein ACNI27_14200 [Desulfovibrio sp.]
MAENNNVRDVLTFLSGIAVGILTVTKMTQRLPVVMAGKSVDVVPVEDRKGVKDKGD